MMSNGAFPTSQVFELFAPTFGLRVFPWRIQVLLALDPIFGLISSPFLTHVLLEFAPILGLISFPDKTQVLPLFAPIRGLSSFLSQTQPFSSLPFQRNVCIAHTSEARVQLKSTNRKNLIEYLKHVKIIFSTSSSLIYL